MTTKTLYINKYKKIDFIKNNHTQTSKALINYLNKNNINYSLNIAKTNSYYFEFDINNVSYSVRLANHTKSYYYENDFAKYKFFYYNDWLVELDSINISELLSIINLFSKYKNQLTNIYNNIANFQFESNHFDKTDFDEKTNDINDLFKYLDNHLDKTNDINDFFEKTNLDKKDLFKQAIDIYNYNKKNYIIKKKEV